MSAMSAAALGVDAVGKMFHYGKKGMHWGVRNDPGHEGEKVEARSTAKLSKKFVKLESKWENSVYSTPGAVAVHNSMADYCNSRIGVLNDKHANANLNKTPYDAETQAYYDEVMSLQTKGYEHAVKTVHGKSPTGSRKAVYVSDEKGERIELHDTSVSHAEEENEPELVILLKMSDAGQILEFNKAELEVEHSDKSKNFFAHYGKKGMRWGVTTVDKASKPTLTREKDMKVMNTKDVTVTQRRAGTYVKSKGGQRQKASDDAVKAQAARQKAKKSTTDALTNDELKAANERMQLEQNYHKLNAKTKRRGESFVAKLFASPEVRSTTADLAKRVATANT